MPNIAEIESGIKALEATAPNALRFIEEIPEVFGNAGRTFSGSAVAEDVAGRLFTMPKQAPMRDMLRVALGTDHGPTLASVSNFFKLPTETRTLLDTSEIS